MSKNKDIDIELYKFLFDKAVEEEKFWVEQQNQIIHKHYLVLGGIGLSFLIAAYEFEHKENIDLVFQILIPVSLFVSALSYTEFRKLRRYYSRQIRSLIRRNKAEIKMGLPTDKILSSPFFFDESIFDEQEKSLEKMIIKKKKKRKEGLTLSEFFIQDKENISDMTKLHLIHFVIWVLYSIFLFTVSGIQLDWF